MPILFVNLKRFDVPRRLGGLCPLDDPVAWIESVLRESIGRQLGRRGDLQLVYLLPEGLVAAAALALRSLPPEEVGAIAVGSQGVHWKDVAPGGNFGAFTTSLPASAARGLGCTWAIIGHSEERRAKLEVMAALEPRVAEDETWARRAAGAVSALVGAEVVCALQAGLNVLLCVGETAQERGDGPFEAQQPRIEAAIAGQLQAGLAGAGEAMGERRIVIGYEPVWAIGPGRVPPGPGYIAFVAGLIKRLVQAQLGFAPAVVYGGGLKEENAAAVAGVESVDGGLVALTRFTGEIGFDVDDLARIVDRYMDGRGR